MCTKNAAMCIKMQTALRDSSQQNMHTLIASFKASWFASTRRLALGLGVATKKVRDVSP
jgi:hypothetical protein